MHTSEITGRTAYGKVEYKLLNVRPAYTWRVMFEQLILAAAMKTYIQYAQRPYSET